MNPSSASTALPILRGMGPPRVVVTLGAQGVVYGDEDGGLTLPAITVRAVDSTGAGDAFCGALAVGLIEGRGWEESLRRANAAGAFAVTRMGAGPSMPTAEELDLFPAGIR